MPGESLRERQSSLRMLHVYDHKESMRSSETMSVCRPLMKCSASQMQHRNRKYLDDHFYLIPGCKEDSFLKFFYKNKTKQHSGILSQQYRGVSLSSTDFCLILLHMELNKTPQYPWGNIVNRAMGSPLLCLILILPRVPITMIIPRQWYPNPWVAYCFGHLALSHWRVACVLKLRPVYPELVMFPDFEFRTSLGTSTLLVTFVSDNSTTKHQNGIQLICSCCPDLRGASLSA